MAHKLGIQLNTSLDIWWPALWLNLKSPAVWIVQPFPFARRHARIRAGLTLVMPASEVALTVATAGVNKQLIVSPIVLHPGKKVHRVRVTQGMNTECTPPAHMIYALRSYNTISVAANNDFINSCHCWK